MDPGAPPREPSRGLRTFWARGAWLPGPRARCGHRAALVPPPSPAHRPLGLGGPQLAWGGEQRARSVRPGLRVLRGQRPGVTAQMLGGGAVGEGRAESRAWGASPRARRPPRVGPGAADLGVRGAGHRWWPQQVCRVLKWRALGFFIPCCRTPSWSLSGTRFPRRWLGWGWGRGGGLVE